MQSGYCRAGCLGSYSFLSLRRTILNPDFKIHAFILQDFDEHKFVRLISSIGDEMNLLSTGANSSRFLIRSACLL
jgi:hypothetical protein